MPVGQAVDVVGHRVLRHPHLLAILRGEHGGFLHVAKWRMSVEVSGDDINLVACRRIVHQRVGVFRVEAQRLSTDESHPFVGVAVEHVGIVLHQVELLLRRIEAPRVAHPPVGLVLNRHRIHGDALLLHPFQECVQPREELLVTVLAQLAALVPLVVGITALSGAIGLIVARWRPGRTEDDAAALLHDLCRRQRAIPVVGRIPVSPLRHDDITDEVR